MMETSPKNTSALRMGSGAHLSLDKAALVKMYLDDKWFDLGKPTVKMKSYGCRPWLRAITHIYIIGTCV